MGCLRRVTSQGCSFGEWQLPRRAFRRRLSDSTGAVEWWLKKQASMANRLEQPSSDGSHHTLQRQGLHATSAGIDLSCRCRREREKVGDTSPPRLSSCSRVVPVQQHETNYSVATPVLYATSTSMKRVAVHGTFLALTSETEGSCPPEGWPNRAPGKQVRRLSVIGHEQPESLVNGKRKPTPRVGRVLSPMAPVPRRHETSRGNRP